MTPAFGKDGDVSLFLSWEAARGAGGGGGGRGLENWVLFVLIREAH